MNLNEQSYENDLHTLKVKTLRLIHGYSLVQRSDGTMYNSDSNEEIKDPTQDLNAAVEAVWSLGYTPHFDPTSWYLDVLILKDGRRYTGDNCLVRKDLEASEAIKAIATALCEALLEAEAENVD